MRKTQRSRLRKRPAAISRRVEGKPAVVIKRILVPIDFSEYSLHALQYAVRFAKQFKAELLLLHVIEPVVYPTDFSFGQIAFPNIEDELHRRGEEELKRLREEVGREVAARSFIRLGKPFLEITEAAREHSADLIIIASHGHTGVEHILFGSTAEKVIRKAHCPVLTVRAKT
jgi:nucleotide-binding universal stress UspA family protein